MIFSQEYRQQWPTSEKVIFRFLFIYFILFIISQFTFSLFEPLVRLTGHLILHIETPISYFPSGSGDTTYAYVALFMNTLITLTATLIWSFIDKKRPAYNTLFYWFLVILRFYLALMMFSYGFAKIYKMQFPGPSLIRLLQPLGDFSPMGLAWTFMGFSEAYNVFTGSLEVLGGLLLVCRKTATLGALIVTVVMTHVAVMNFTYDIPVKLFSLHLVTIALFIASTDGKRIFRLFISNKPTSHYHFYYPIKNHLYEKIKNGFKIVAVGLVIGTSIWQGYNGEREYGDKRVRPKLYGIWEVETMTVNDEVLPPLLTDENRWRYLVVDYESRAAIKYMTDEKKWMTLKIDSIDSKITLYEGDNKQEDNFDFSRSDNELYLEGTLYGHRMKIKLKVKDLDDILLINRGFHWINEYPFNK